MVHQGTPTTPSDTVPMRPSPPIPRPVLEWLEGIYPDRLPRKEPSQFELGRLVGQQDVIQKLRHEFDARKE